MAFYLKSVHILHFHFDVVSFDIFFHSYKEVAVKMNLLQIIIFISASIILVSSAKKEGNKITLIEQ